MPVSELRPADGWRGFFGEVGFIFDKDEPRSKMLDLIRARPICRPLMVDGRSM